MAENRINIVISAEDKGSSVVNKFGNSLDDASTKSSGFGASLSRIKDVALGVYLPQLGMKLLELGKNALTSTGNFEQSRVAFETMLGSAEKAQDLLTQISQFAKNTPFDLPGVVDASKQLLAYGFAQDEVLPTMRKLGDVAAGVSVPIGQLTAVYGQVRVAGKLMGQDLLQFTQAGVPLLDYLAQTMGKTAAQIKKDMEGGVGPSFDQVQTALEAMTSSGSKFGGLMEKQSHTFQGVMSNIGDSFGQIGRLALGMDSAGNVIKGGFFDRIEDAASSLMPILENSAGQIAAFMSGSIGLAMDGFKNLQGIIQLLATGDFKHGMFSQGIEQDSKVVAVVLAIRDAFMKAWQFIQPAVNELATAFKRDLMPALAELWKQMAPLLQLDLAATFMATVGVIYLLVKALSVLVEFITFYSNAIATGIEWGVAFSNKLVEIATVIATEFKKSMDFIASLPAMLNNFIGQLVTTVSGGIQYMISWFEQLPQRAIYAMAFLAGWLLTFATVDVPNFIGSVASWFDQLPVRIGAAVMGVAATVSAWFTSTKNDATNTAVQTVNSVAGLFESLPGRLGAAAAGLWNGVVGGFTSFGKSLLAWANAAVDAIVAYFKDLPNRLATAVGNAAQGVKDNLGSFFGDLGKTIQAGFNAGQKHAVGTNFAPGGMSLVGEHGPELVNLPTGSRVTPAWQTASQGTSQGAGSYTTTITGNIYLQSAEAADRFFDRIDKTQRLARMGLA